MGYLEFCSNCGSNNKFGEIDGNRRYYCLKCNAIHYENPKPTVALVCPRNNEILLVKRAASPGRGLWGLPGGFIERGESPECASKRELKEETMLGGNAVTTLGTCSHYNTIFGDILLIGLETQIDNWSDMQAGDDCGRSKNLSNTKTPKTSLFMSRKNCKYV